MESIPTGHRPAVTDLRSGYWPNALASSHQFWGAPSLVLGWTCELRDPHTREVDEKPATLIRFDHQFGGYACLQASMIGVIFPLEFSKPRLRNVEELIEVFTIFSSDGTGPMRAQQARLGSVVPGLQHWWLNGNNEMNQGARSVWDTALHRWLDVPPVRSGIEAMIGFGPVGLDPMRGWKSAAFSLKDERLVGVPVEFRKAEFDDLCLFGANHELGEPELWFVWENSD